MAEPFNVEQFRQQMRGQTLAAPQPVPAQMQAAPAAMMAPPAPQPFQAQPQMVPPMPQNPIMQPQAQAQPQPQPQPQAYSPPAGGQQQWPPQGHAMPAPQMMPTQAGMPHMPQAPVFTPPPGAMAEEMMEEVTAKKSRFSLKRSTKEKAPKVKKVKLEKAEGVSSKKSPILPYLLGLISGVILTFVATTVL